MRKRQGACASEGKARAEAEETNLIFQAHLGLRPGWPPTSCNFPALGPAFQLGPLPMHWRKLDDGATKRVKEAGMVAMLVLGVQGDTPAARW